MLSEDSSQILVIPEYPKDIPEASSVIVWFAQSTRVEDIAEGTFGVPTHGGSKVVACPTPTHELVDPDPQFART